MKTLIAAASLFVLAPVNIAFAEATEQQKEERVMLTAHVKGMVCDFCAQAVTKVFGKEDAVKSVHVDLDKGEIHISLNPGMDIADAKVEDLVRKSGYSLTSVSRDVL